MTINRTIAVLAATLTLAAGCHKAPDAQAMALREALIRLRVATEQGASLVQFSGLLLDAGTKFEIAKGHVSDDSNAKCAAAITAADDARDLWQASSEKNFPADSEKQMERLGVVKNNLEFGKFLADSILTDPDYEADSSAALDAKREARETLVHVIVGKALHAVHARVADAEQSIPAQ